MQNLRKKVENYFKDRFGVTKNFWNDYKFHKKGKSIWTTTKKMNLDRNFTACGIRTLRIINDYLKPTTYILQILDKKIEKNTKNLNENEFQKLVLKREPIESSKTPGYISLKFKSHIIGCGLINSNQRLKTQISKERTKELRKIYGK